MKIFGDDISKNVRCISPEIGPATISATYTPVAKPKFGPKPLVTGGRANFACATESSPMNTRMNVPKSSARHCAAYCFSRLD